MTHHYGRHDPDPLHRDIYAVDYDRMSTVGWLFGVLIVAVLLGGLFYLNRGDTQQFASNSPAVERSQSVAGDSARPAP